jgi:hypothetical protein
LNLSNQGLSGTIPFELGFLPNLVDLDLSHNSLTGQLPAELALASLQTLILAENSLSGYVPDALCRKSGINGNGNSNESSCDYIACPMGTYHPEGHATPDRPCEPCPMVDGLVLANTNCGLKSLRDSTSSQSNGSRMPDWSQILVVSVVGAFLILLGYVVLRKINGTSRGQQKSNKQTKLVLPTSKVMEDRVDSSVGLTAAATDLSLQSLS